MSEVTEVMSSTETLASKGEILRTFNNIFSEMQSESQTIRLKRPITEDEKALVIQTELALEGRDLFTHGKPLKEGILGRWGGNSTNDRINWSWQNQRAGVHGTIVSAGYIENDGIPVDGLIGYLNLKTARLATQLTTASEAQRAELRFLMNTTQRQLDVLKKYSSDGTPEPDSFDDMKKTLEERVANICERTSVPYGSEMDKIINMDGRRILNYAVGKEPKAVAYKRKSKEGLISSNAHRLRKLGCVTTVGVLASMALCTSFVEQSGKLPNVPTPVTTGGLFPGNPEDLSDLELVTHHYTNPADQNDSYGSLVGHANYELAKILLPELEKEQTDRQESIPPNDPRLRVDDPEMVINKFKQAHPKEYQLIINSYNISIKSHNPHGTVDLEKDEILVPEFKSAPMQLIYGSVMRLLATNHT